MRIVKERLWFDMGVAWAALSNFAEELDYTGMSQLAEEVKRVSREAYQLACRAIAGQPEHMRALCSCGRTGQVHYSGEAPDCPGFRPRGA